MTEWRTARLDWLASEERRTVDPQSFGAEEVFHYSIPTLDELGDGQLEPATEIGSDKLLLSGGEVLVSKLNPRLPRVLQAESHDVPTLASTEFIALRPGPQVVAGFLCYWLQSEYVRQFLDGATMSVTRSQQRIRPDVLTKRWLSIPSRPGQRAIAEFLDAETAHIDALIAKKVRLRNLAGSRLRARVANLTGALVTVGLNGGATSVAHGWQNVRLRRCFTVMDYGIGEASKAAGRVAVLGMANVDDHGRVRGEPGGYVDRVEPRLLLRESDLLFNRTNSLAKVGKLGLVRELPQPTTFASYLVRFRTSAIADPQYLNYALNTLELLELARSSALPSIGQANLNPSRYTGLRLALPSLDEQRRIVTELDAEQHRVESLALTLERQIALLRNRRQALITAAVTGELDIPGLAA